jgi:phosphoribosylanthranilate isomerase
MGALSLESRLQTKKEKAVKWRVTITGADDQISPEDLLAISEQYPLVEWGLLFSTSRQGTPRYPSKMAIEKFCQTSKKNPQLKLSAHLCGTYARLIGEGHAIDMPEQFSRLQLNGFLPSWNISVPRHTCEVILQVRREEHIQSTVDYTRERPGISFSLLFDPSGGHGIETFRWPPPPSDIALGYAGGIRPENVREVLSEIVQVHTTVPIENTWIDLETGARDEEDRFSLSRVKELLVKIP